MAQFESRAKHRLFPVWLFKRNRREFAENPEYAVNRDQNTPCYPSHGKGFRQGYCMTKVLSSL